MMNNMNNNGNVNFKLSAGDKIKLVKPIGPLGEDFVGDVYEITKYENGLYYFECPYGMGCFTPNEFDNHFEMANDKESDEYEEIADMWAAMSDAYRKMMGDTEDNEKHDCCEHKCNYHGCHCFADDEEVESYDCEDEDEFEFEPGDDMPDYVKDILEQSEIVCSTVFDCCAVVSCKLPNGYIIVEHSASIDADEYDYAEQVEICMDNIIDKVISLEAYRDMCDFNKPKSMTMPNVNVDVDKAKLDEMNKRIKNVLAEEERKKRDEETLAELDEILNKLNESKDTPYVDDFKFRVNPWWN